MDMLTQLEKAKAFNENDKPKAAIKILKPLYQANPANLDILLEVATAFELLEQWGNARGMLSKAIKQNPQDTELWIRLSNLYQAEEDLATAMKAIDKGLSVNRDDLSLLIQRSHLLSDSDQVEAMHDQMDKAIEKHPEYKNDLLMERASIYESRCYDPQPDEEQVTDHLGMSFAVAPLQQAIDDLTAAITSDNTNWQLNFKRARIYKQLQDFERAIADFDEALNLLDEDTESFRDYIQEQRDACLNGGRNEREHLADLMRQGLINVDDQGELSQDDLMANNLLDAIAGQLAEGKDMMSLLDSIEDDPDQLIAMNIAQEILKNGREPTADFTPTDKTGFRKSAQRFCDQVEKKIRKYEFKSLGDFEPRGLSQQIGKRILLRLFCSNDQKICGAAFELIPAKPAFLSWLLLVILRKWKAVRILELESETSAGRFIITNNTGELNPFIAGDAIDMLTLPVKTSVRDIVMAHFSQLQKYSQDDIKLIPDLNAVFAMQERLRVAKNAYRERIGYVTDAELKQMLGKQYDKYAADIRKYLDKFSSSMA